MIFDALKPLAHANLANPPANLTEFFGLAARSLADMDEKAVADGVQDIILTQEFFPRIATLRTAAQKAALAGHSRITQNAGIPAEYARARATQPLADKNPADWTDEDHAEFERWYGHPVWWKGAPICAEVVA